MNRHIFGRSGKWLREAGKTAEAQFSKDIVSMIRSGYYPIIMTIIVIVTALILYSGHHVNSIPDSYFLFSESLKHNIINIIFESFFELYPLLLLIVPAISITDDIETKNFHIFRTFNSNMAGYYVGKILSSLLLVMVSLITIGYIGEGTLFYDGYLFTSGFLIDPVIMALLYIPVLLVEFSFIIFISTLLPNKILPIFVLIFSSFFSSLVLSTFSSNLITGGNIYEFFYLLATQAQQMPFSYLGYNFNATYRTTITSAQFFYGTAEFSGIFLVLGFVSILVRNNYAGIIFKMKELKDSVFRGDLIEKE